MEIEISLQRYKELKNGDEGMRKWQGVSLFCSKRMSNRMNAEPYLYNMASRRALEKVGAIHELLEKVGAIHELPLP